METTTVEPTAIIQFPERIKNTISVKERDAAKPVWISKRWPTGFEAELEYIFKSGNLNDSRKSSKTAYSILLASMLCHYPSYVVFPKSSIKHDQFGVTKGIVTKFISSMLKAGYLKVAWKQSQSHLRIKKRSTAYAITPELIEIVEHIIN